MRAVRLVGRSQVVLDSAGLGWRDMFASITSGREWSGRVAPSEHIGLAYCLRGVNRVTRALDGEAAETIAFRPRQFGLMPTRIGASYEVTGGADVAMIYLRGAMARRVAARLGRTGDSVLALDARMGFHDPLLEQLCLVVLATLQRQDPVDDPAYVDMLAELAAAHCLRVHTPGEALRDEEPASAPTAAAVHRVCAYVDARLDGDLSLDALSREAGLTPSSLTQAFHRVHGATPHQWVIRRRVERARRLLAETNLPMVEVALRTGFASQSHLSSAFKRVTGATPGAFRRAR